MLQLLSLERMWTTGVWVEELQYLPYRQQKHISAPLDAKRSEGLFLFVHVKYYHCYFTAAHIFISVHFEHHCV